MKLQGYSFLSPLLTKPPPFLRERKSFEYAWPCATAGILIGKDETPDDVVAEDLPVRHEVQDRDKAFITIECPAGTQGIERSHENCFLSFASSLLGC